MVTARFDLQHAPGDSTNKFSSKKDLNVRCEDRDEDGTGHHAHAEQIGLFGPPEWGKVPVELGSEPYDL